jgi:SapC
VPHIVPLNNIDHADLQVAQGYGATYGDAVNLTRVFATEFEALQREYVILFRPDPEGSFQAVVLLGLDRDENLYLDGDAWSARYVPAIQRRGPFSIGVQAGDTPGQGHDPRINVDLEDPRIVRQGGEPVFRRHGGHTDYLNGVSQALFAIYEGLAQTRAMFAAFSEVGLIEPVAIDITIGEGLRYDLDRFHAVSRERLAALTGPELERLHRDGWLETAIYAAASMANIDHLVARKNAKAAGG